MRTRWSAYAGVSAVLAGGVIVKALAQRPNFYSAAVYLSQSSANLMILTNFIFVTACTLLLGLQQGLYGPLRPIEIEQLYEKAWFAVTETCLAMTIFRGEIGAWFLVMFFALLAGKVWAWIGEGRVEILEQQPPRNPRLFHTRLALSLSLSILFDLTLLEYVVKQVMHMARPDMMVMFGFEFAVLSIVSLSTAARYAINLVEIGIIRKQKARKIDEIRRERIAAAVREINEAMQTSSGAETTTVESNLIPELSTVPVQAREAARRALQRPIDEQEIEVEGWDGKGRWIFYLDLTTDFFKLVVYLSFFFILLIFYGLPIHILRDVFMTFRSFFKRIGDFLRYRTATRDMHTRYPDATEHEIGSEDVCIICREEMRPYQPPANGERQNPVAERMRPKKLPCGHILHFSCLRSWLERQQICPTCRTNVVSQPSNQNGQNVTPADGGPVAQQGNAPPAARHRPRIYQWGPLRIGIGAARGNVLEDLQNQLGDGQQRPGQQAQGDGPQQYGFGIRWDGLRRRDRTDRGQRTISRQLDEVQRQLSQEYRALGQMTNELRLLRNMEAELTRLRAQRQGGTAATPTVPQHGNTALPSVMALTGNPLQTISASSDQLPVGMTLPEGWSLMPLHPTQAGIPPTAAPNFPGPLTSLQGGPPSNGHPMAPSPGIPLNSPPQPATTIPHQHNMQSFQPPGGIFGPMPDATQARPSRPPWLDLPRHLGPVNQNGSSLTRPSNQPAQVQSTLNGQSSPNLGFTNAEDTTQTNFQPVREDTSPVANGSAGIHQRASSPDETPVASMFTLPSWGSTPMAPSSSNRAVNEAEHDDERLPQFDSALGSNLGSTSQGQTGDASAPATTGKSKHPTVEDLVEDPD